MRFALGATCSHDMPLEGNRSNDQSPLEIGEESGDIIFGQDTIFMFIYTHITN